MSARLNPAEIIRLLGMRPHPEGGHFCETFRDSKLIDGKRPASTAIYFLLTRGERSQWHRVDAAEGWHWHAGAPLRLTIFENGRGKDITLGADLAAGERPQAVVPAHAWQTAESLGDWSLVGATVAPGFEWAGFEIAPKDWAPE
jgi:predicted cupin superfamily sugar epimerase